MNADYVTKKAVVLLKRLHGCTIGAAEFTGGWSGQRVDAILFNAYGSFLVETKISRSDFLADSKKPHHQGHGGVGRWRYYACPDGLIKPDELPQKWGLIYIPEKGAAYMPVGYGGSLPTGKKEKREGESWERPIYRHYGTHDPYKPYSREARDDFSFDDRCLKIECRFLFYLAKRYKENKFMERVE